VPHFPNPSNATVRRRHFVRRKGKTDLPGVVVHSLESFL